jgi:hypothetical protein
MFPVSLHTRITQLCKILQGIFHIPFSLLHMPAAYSYLYASALGGTVLYLFRNRTSLKEVHPG